MPSRGVTSPTAGQRGRQEQGWSAAYAALRATWLSVLLVPVAVLAAFVVATGLADLLGPGLATFVAYVVAAIPGVVTFVLGRHASALGANATAPMLLCVFLSWGFIAHGFVSWLVGLIVG